MGKLLCLYKCCGVTAFFTNHVTIYLSELVAQLWRVSPPGIGRAEHRRGFDPRSDHTFFISTFHLVLYQISAQAIGPWKRT